MDLLSRMEVWSSNSSSPPAKDLFIHDSCSRATEPPLGDAGGRGGPRQHMDPRVEQPHDVRPPVGGEQSEMWTTSRRLLTVARTSPLCLFPPTFFVCLCDVSHVDDVMNKLYSFPELLMSRTGLASPTHPHLLAMRWEAGAVGLTGDPAPVFLVSQSTPSTLAGSPVPPAQSATREGGGGIQNYQVRLN